MPKQEQATSTDLGKKDVPSKTEKLTHISTYINTHIDIHLYIYISITRIQY